MHFRGDAGLVRSHTVRRRGSKVLMVDTQGVGLSVRRLRQATPASTTLRRSGYRSGRPADGSRIAVLVHDESDAWDESDVCIDAGAEAASAVASSRGVR